jgi:integrase/recombinase XerD
MGWMMPIRLVTERDKVRAFLSSGVGPRLSCLDPETATSADVAQLIKMRDAFLTLGHIDRGAKSCKVLGKGNKHRIVYYGAKTSRAIWSYMREDDVRMEDPEAPLFLSDRGRGHGQALTTSGLRQLIERIGEIASVEQVRCSPHTFRHTFAITMLRNGATVFAVQQMLGHTRLEMTQKYVAYAQADVAKQHRTAGPVDRMRKR